MTTLECFSSQALLVIMFFTLSFAGVEPLAGGKNHQKLQNSFNVYSTFETLNNTKVTTQIGGSAVLPCIVEESTVAIVTWVRRSDYRLLTVGLSTYSSDERFHIEHTRHKGIWDLRIKAVQKEDEGIYECNLSHHPPESIFIEVIVVEAVAEIKGAPDVFIDEGSTLKLECKIVQATENPSYVFWYHQDKMVNFNDGYSVILPKPSASPQLNQDFENIHVERIQPTLDSFNIIQHNHLTSSKMQQIQPEVASSILLVHEVQLKHAGNYTCAPSNTRPTNINVHVLKGDKPAAMKHSNKSVTAASTSSDAPKNLSCRYSFCTNFVVFLAFRFLLYSIIFHLIFHV